MSDASATARDHKDGPRPQALEVELDRASNASALVVLTGIRRSDEAARLPANGRRDAIPRGVEELLELLRRPGR